MHVSNAAGLLDEGLPYEEGDADLDGAVRGLAPTPATSSPSPWTPDEDKGRAEASHAVQSGGARPGPMIDWDVITGRPPIAVDGAAVARRVAGRTVLVTGAGRVGRP